jgi:hypothetical protein
MTRRRLFSFAWKVNANRGLNIQGRILMLEPESPKESLATDAGRLVGHVMALVVGLVLMFAGVAMGVTMVLLPLGIPLGLVGLCLFIWGVFGRSREKTLPVQRPNGP